MTTVSSNEKEWNPKHIEAKAARHFPDDILKWILVHENARISIKISLKFVPWFPINKFPSVDSDSNTLPPIRALFIAITGMLPNPHLDDKD